MIQLADKIIFGFGLYVATEAISAEAINDISKTPVTNATALSRDIEFKKLPVVGGSVPS